jgi:predicted branched-subunit amino acid permease
MQFARAAWRDPEFRRGVADMGTVAPGVAAWGLITGITMVKSGLSVPLALAMTLLVFAGSAQLAALPLIASGAPLWVIWATALCVNLRFVIFSAQWRPYLRHLPQGTRLRLAYFTADLNFVVFMRRWPRPEPAAGQLPYIWGGVAINWGSWQLASIAGILLADVIPPQWGIGFAGTLALVALVCALLSDRATAAAAAVAGAAAVAAYALPLKLNILVAIAAAVAAGLLVDHHAPRSAAQAPDPT